MKTLLSTKGFLVFKEHINNDEKLLIESELMVAPDVEPINKFTPGPAKFPVYRVSEKRYRVPRHWGLERFELHTTTWGINSLSIDTPFKGKLKSETKQPEAVKAVIESLDSCGGAILCLPTGYGKTSSALYVISQMKVKTLVIVHKEFLMSQWKERIEQFLPSANIGIIQANKIEIQGKDIVIGMLQSLSMKDYPPETFNSFGMIVVDEAHHICTKTFSCALMNYCPKYTLGLSATIERKDGLTKVIKWFLGPIAYSIERETKETYVNMVNFKCEKFYEDMPVMTGGKVCVPQVINILVDIPERNDLILELIKKYNEEGRRIIVLTDRRNHCELLQKRCSEFTTSGLYIGGMSQAKLKESEECKVICATYSLAQEGLDIPVLDTCVLATPKTDVVQATGRVMRETPGKQFSPLIVDIVDMWGVLIAQSKKRKKFYVKSCFTIEGNKSAEPKPKEEKIKGFAFVEEIT